MAYRTIGNTVAEWDDREPFIFTMTEANGDDDDRRSKTIAIDMSGLRKGYTEEFLQHLKDHLMERRKRVVLSTIETEAKQLKRLFSKVIDINLFDNKISVIDEAFILCLGSVKESLSAFCLKHLKQAFRDSPHSPLFSRDIQASDFPVLKNKKGFHGSQIDRILGIALSQAAVVHILDLCDTAYARGKIDIGHYSFAHLAFAVFCRPESYRQIRLKDFWFDPEQNQYFLAITRVKTGEHQPRKVIYGINKHLGVLLQKQRQHVVSTYGHLVPMESVDKLALFPARKLQGSGSRWLANYPNENFGMYEKSDHFSRGYPQALKKLFNDSQFTLSANALRHTVGTLLAQTGASAQTIQAVLKHASDMVCRAYVDIAFHGMIKELSKAMHPTFQEHLPALLNFRSKNDPSKSEKVIRSEDLESGRIEETGECGKDIACQNAPIVCYGCFRFRPCWDADHSINLGIVQREIDDMSQRGKPFHHMVERAKTVKNRILVIMYAADRYRDALRQGGVQA